MTSSSLRTKLILSSITLTFLTGSIIVGLIYTYVRSTLFSKETETLKILSIEQSHDVNTEFKHALLLSNKISEDIIVKDYLSDDAQELKEQNLQSYLQNQQIDEIHLAIYILDKQGIAKASTDESFIGNNYSFRRYFKNSISGSNFVDTAIGVTSNELGFYVSSPVYDNFDQIVGVTVIKLQPDSILESLVLPDIYKNANIMLIEDHGIIIYTNSEHKRFKSLGNLNSKQKKEIDQYRLFEGIDIEALSYNSLQNEINNISAPKTYELYDETDKSNKVLTITPIQNTSLFITIEENAREIDKSSTSIAFILSIVMIISMILQGLLLSYIISKQLLPLVKLNAVVNQIASGELNRRIKLDTGDEIEQLAENINKMADSLTNNLFQVEKQVRDRTQRLEKLIDTMAGREKKMKELKEKINKLKQQNDN